MKWLSCRCVEHGVAVLLLYYSKSAKDWSPPGSGQMSPVGRTIEFDGEVVANQCTLPQPVADEASSVCVGAPVSCTATSYPASVQAGLVSVLAKSVPPRQCSSQRPSPPLSDPYSQSLSVGDPGIASVNSSNHHQSSAGTGKGYVYLFSHMISQ